MTNEERRVEVKKQMEKMSNWQFYLFLLKMKEKYPAEYLEPAKDVLDYLAENPARFVMYLAFCIGLRPWLWFGVAK